VLGVIDRVGAQPPFLAMAVVSASTSSLTGALAAAADGTEAALAEAGAGAGAAPPLALALEGVPISFLASRTKGMKVMPSIYGCSTSGTLTPSAS